MGLFSKCGFYGLLSVALLCSFFASFFGDFNAHAASQFDDTVRNVDQLVLSHPDCSEDLTFTPNNLITPLSPSLDWNGNSNEEEWKNAYLDALNSGNWAISQHSFSGEKRINYYYTTQPGKTQFFEAIAPGYERLAVEGTSDNRVYRVSIVINTYNNCEPVAYDITKNNFKYTISTPPNSIWTNNSSGGYEVYLSNFPVTYPPSYAGEPIKDTVVKLQDLQPEVLYKVSGYDLDAMVCFEDAVTDTNKVNLCPATKFLWGYNTIINWELKHDPADTTTIKSQTGDFSTSANFKHTFDQFGTYWLIVYFSHPGVPYETAEQKGYKLHALNIPIKIDGTTYVSGSGKQKCINGVCQHYTELKDCNMTIDSLSALGERIGCEFYNFGITFRNILNYLFLPDMGIIKKFLNNFIEQLKTSLGFLYAPIDFFVQVFQLVGNQTTNPTGNTCSLGSISMFGHSGTIELCAWRYQFPQYWDLMQTALRGGIAIGLLVAFWRKLNALFGHNVEDDGDGANDEYSGSDSWDWVDERTGERGNVGKHRRGEQ